MIKRYQKVGVRVIMPLRVKNLLAVPRNLLINPRVVCTKQMLQLTYNFRYSVDTGMPVCLICICSSERLQHAILRSAGSIGCLELVQSPEGLDVSIGCSMVSKSWIMGWT